MIRLFAALPLPDRATARLVGLQKGLPGRVVAPENFHVTLGFFGEIPEPQAEELHGALEAIRAPGFNLWLDGLGLFGAAKPRNLHALVRPDPALAPLRDKVLRAARGVGLTPEGGRYSPHVTLTRLSAGALAPSEAAALLQARGGFTEGPHPMRGFTLYRSDLGKAGPRYEALATYPLGPF